MAYNYFTGGGPAYHFNSNMDSQIWGEEQYDMQSNPAWDMNMVDPILMNEGIMEPFHEYDQQGHPMQKFLTELERTWCNVPPLDSHSHIGYNKPHEAQAPFPYASDCPGDSPSSTESSCALSPRAESERYQDSYYQTQNIDASSPLSRPMSHLSHSPQEIWQGKLPQPMMAPFNGVVSLSELQGRPDPQEVTFQNSDEGYDYLNEKDFSFEAETGQKSEGRSRHYRHKSDSAIGPSIKGEDDSESTIIVMNSSTDDDEADADEDADADADGEDEGTIEVAPAFDEDEDEEYSPTRTSKRKRTMRSFHTAAATPSKRQKASPISRPSATTVTKSGKHKCPTCAHTSKDATTLSKHINSQHTRPYVCTFAFAGCNSTFGNKNEWKRHVASQHLGLRVWVCVTDACASKASSASSSTGDLGGAVFNRKDLFTQHLRRMHAPFKVKRQGKNDARWEDEVRELQVSSERVLRKPPPMTCCPVVGCDNVFEGTNSWDERMEHVGRHLEGEKDAVKNGEEKCVVMEEGDAELMSWAVKEGIIERSANGWAFSTGEKVEDDVDAEGEDE